MGQSRAEASVYMPSSPRSPPLIPDDRKLVYEKSTPQSQEESWVGASLHLEGFIRICGVLRDVAVHLT